MTIPASMPIRVVYRGDGATVNFPIPFLYFANSDGTKQLSVLIADDSGENEQVMVENTDFSITAAGEPNGTLTLISPLVKNKKLTIVYNIPIEQPVDWEEFGRLPSESIEQSFDKVAAILKQHQEILERCVKVVVSGNQSPQELLDEVYGKLDSATDIAADARCAADEATTAANNATAAVSRAEQTLADVSSYVDAGKIDIEQTVSVAKQNIADTVTAAENSIEQTIVAAVVDVKEQAVNAAQAVVDSAAETVINTAKANLDTYVDGTVEPSLQSYLDDAAQSASAAAADAAIVAGKVDEAAQSAAAALSSAAQAGQSATAAANSAESAGDSAGLAQSWAVGNAAERPEGSAKTWAEKASNKFNMVEGAVADGLSALANAGNALRNTQISNCILSYPKRIKFEQPSPGTLTLKAGSVVCIPNGPGNFEFYTLPSDVSDINMTTHDSETRLVCYSKTQNRLYIFANHTSGTTDYTGSGNNINYRTDLNLVKVTLGGQLSNDLVSFPVIQVKGDGTYVTANVLNVFDAGFIGNTQFVLPGLTALIPNGFSADGTLNNITYTTSTVIVSNYSCDIRQGQRVFLFEGGKLESSSDISEYYEQAAYIGDIYGDENGKITSIVSRPALRLIDVYELLNVFLPNYQPPIVRIQQTSGTVALKVAEIYAMTVDGATTFTPPEPSNRQVYNQIKVMLKVVGTPTINWGTVSFFNKTTPEIEAGSYDVYFDYDELHSCWVCGALPKGAAA